MKKQSTPANHKAHNSVINEKQDDEDLESVDLS